MTKPALKFRELAAIAGSTFAGVSLGIGAGEAWQFYHLAGTNAGDKLQFLGSVLGSGLGVIGAVGGAVLIENYKRWNERSATRAPLIEALTQLQTAMAHTAASAERLRSAEQIDLVAERDAARTLLGEMDDALEMLELTSHTAAIDTMQQMLALHRLRKGLADLRPILATEQRIVANAPPNRGIVMVFYDKVGGRASALADLTSQARRLL